MTTTLIIVLVCIVAESFFSGTEIAIVNANRMLLLDKAQKGSFGAKIAYRFLDNPEMLLGSTLIGTNLCTVTGAMTVTLYLLDSFGPSGEIYAVLLFWPLSFFFGEIVPKTFYQANADRIAPYAALVLRVFTFALFPVVWVFTQLSKILIQLLRDKSKGEPVITRGDVKALTRLREPNGDIDPEEKRFIKRMIDFSSARVSDAMIPLIDVIGINSTTRAGEAAAFANEQAFSRFPVYHERVDQIVGTIDTFSLLNIENPSDPLRKYMTKAVYVPESMSVKTLLAQLRHSGVSMAIVVDEYGGAVGIITVEDVLEEIIGDIEDEFDSGEPLYRKIGDRTYVFQARAEVDFINERFDFAIPEGEYETLGGFLLEQFGHIPRHNQTLNQNNICFKVLNPTNRSLTEVQINLPDPSAEPEKS
jgi:CBS domain containing-hemolysin-like protein